MHYYIFIISQLWLTSHPKSIVVLLDTGTPCTSREIFQQLLLSLLAQWLEHTVYNRGFASLSLTIGILTVNFSTDARSSCVQ